MNQVTCGVFGGVWYPGVTCDQVQCETNCGGDCSPGEVLDCYGHCVPVSWIGDGECDSGQYQWDTNNIYLDCEEFGYDGGDCTPPAELPVSAGACCIGDLDSCDARICEEVTYAGCINVNGQFLGEHTACLEETCQCPPGQMADCNGNCFPIYYMNDGICHEGHWYPENGDGAFAYQLNLGCLELACDSGDCVGVCSGACCVGNDCVGDIGVEICVEQGGTFLGGGESCVDVDCSFFLVPQSIASEMPSDESTMVSNSGAAVAAEGDIVLVALLDAKLVSNGQDVKAMNIYRDQGRTFAQSVYVANSNAYQPPLITTDGQRAVMAFENHIRIYMDNGKTFVLEQSIELDASVTIGSVSVSGDKLIATNYFFSDELFFFKRVGTTWNEQEPVSIAAGPSIQKAVVDGDDLVVMTYYSIVTFNYQNGAWQEESGYISLQGGQHDIAVDNGRFIVGETADTYPGSPSVAQARIFKKVNNQWTFEAFLIPLDTHPDDDYGLSVSIDGNVACVAGRKNDSAIMDGGIVSVFRRVDNDWTYANKVLPSNGLPQMRFGFNVATNGVSVVGSWRTEYINFDSEILYGVQIAQLDAYEWIDSDGGSIHHSNNWSPSMPSVGDTVSVAVPASFEMNVSSSLPFSRLNVGPSKPTLNMQGQSVTLGNSIESGLSVMGTQHITGDLELENGELTVPGDVVIGSTYRPGALSIASDASIDVEGHFTLLKNSQIHIELGSNQVTPIQIGDGVVVLNGSLIVKPSSSEFDPAIGSSWTLIESETLPSENERRFDVVIMPGISYSKYFDLEYQETSNGYALTATVAEIAGLYDLEDTDSVSVSGRATDLEVKDVGSPAGPMDGYSDLVLSVGGTPGSMLVFISDGQGGVGSQITYTVGNGPSSVAVGKLDTDHTNDIIVTNAIDDSVTIFTNDGGNVSNLTQQSPISTGDFPIDLLIMNTDVDSENEVVVSCNGEEDVLPDGTVAGEIRFYEVDTNLALGLNFAGAIPLEKPGRLDPGDVNNDKDLDLSVSLGAASKAARMRNVGGLRGFNWEVVQEVNVGSQPFDLQMGDLDGDGDDDLVVANRGTDTLSLFKLESNNMFGEELVIEVGNNPISLDLLDYDGDGDLDIAVIADVYSGEKAISLYRNDTSLNQTGELAFALEQILDEGRNPILVGSGEMDGDAADELVSVVESSGFAGVVSDIDVRSIPDSASCEGDFTDDGTVGVDDLLVVIGAWGTPNGDLNGDGTTSVDDLLVLIGLWGDCE